MARTLRIGTRKSPLAIKQVDEAITSLKRIYPDIEVDVIPIDTYGDGDKDTPISDIEGTDFFTRELDQALLKGEIDFAIHSAKDLPDRLAQGLELEFTTESIDPYDCLVSKSGLKLDELPQGAKIGTSSLRRKTQLKKYRNDFEIIDIRGNIGERLEKLDNSDLDAIVIATAGLIRLGLEHRMTQKIPFRILRPHPLQGSLTVVRKSVKV
ncbi:MAG: hydroxymethylbilane synthase [Candidatus Omnitrophica bacterium]|nr:hydroxymethylbilane synthase [Candidatus Omnitrophota bacterium]